MLEIIYYLLYMLQGITAGIFIHLMLTPKHKNYISLLVWAIASIWVPIGRVIQLADENMKIIVMFSGLFEMFFVALFLYKEPVWKKLTAVLMTLLASLFADCFVVIAFYLVDPSFLDASTGINLQTTIIGAAGEAGNLIAYFIMLIIWNAIKKHSLIKGFLPTLLLPISQLCFASSANLGLQGHSEMYSYTFFIGEILGFILDVYWMYELVYRSRRTEAEQELVAIKRVMELEELHYRSIENKREEIAKIRHDIKNQLIAMKYLIEENQGKTADKMIDELAEKLEKTTEYEYCTSPIVNAVIGEKNNICNMKKIKLSVKVFVPETNRINDVVLCSIFGNVLDNAINASSEMDENNRYIKLSSISEGGFWVIKIVNSSNEPEKIKPGHGKGTVILKEIATRYNGKYSTKYSDNEFTAIVSLEI